MGLVFSKLGSYTESARLGFAFGLAYWIVDTPKGIVGVGVHVDVASDAWGNTVNAPPGAVGCPTAIAQDESATEFGFYGVGAVAYRFTERLRVGAEGGLGATDYTADSLGGDVFVPTCHLNPLQVAVHAGLEVSYAILPRLRAVAAPTFALHPAYAGARTAPVDASGSWTRIGVGLGVALDL